MALTLNKVRTFLGVDHWKVLCGTQNGSFNAFCENLFLELFL